MREQIHLDSAGHTPVAAEVKDAMAAAADFGNPSSMTRAGQRAREAVEQARRQVAALLQAEPFEISFTSCGTESNTWALRGLSAGNKRKGKHLVISAIEHPSVTLAAKRLALDGAELAVLPVGGEAVVAPETLKSALRPDTVLVSIMLANGEVGTIEPIAELAAIAHEQGAVFHTDAVAAVGHIHVDVKALGVEALSLAADQFGGPPGAAALFAREGVRILPLLEGGGQERGGRSGTEHVPAIVGMGVAAELAARELAARVERLSGLRDRLRDGLLERLEGVRVNGSWADRPACAVLRPAALRAAEAGGAAGRLPHNLHVCVEGVASESLVLGLDQAGLEAGMGSACNAKSLRPSAVLKAMGLTDEQAGGALVLTLGAGTTAAEIDRALEIIPEVVGKLRRVTAMTARTERPGSGNRELGSVH